MWMLWHILLDVTLDSVEGYSVAGLELNPSANLLPPPMRLCGLIGSMWRFVMTTKLLLITVKVKVFLQGQCGLEMNFINRLYSRLCLVLVFSLQSCPVKCKYFMQLAKVMITYLSDHLAHICTAEY